MELIKDTPFEAVWQVWMKRPAEPCLTVVVKATFTVVERGTCPIAPEQAPPQGDQYHDDAIERSQRYESDFAFLKPRGECYLVGSCHAPGGRPTPVAMAGFKVGPLVKQMAVIGDRHYKGLICGQSEPEPFTSMPLLWERSFGGPTIAANPVGLGVSKSVVDGKKMIRLPNLEDPKDLIKRRSQRPKPMGAAPIPRRWPQRIRLAGSYDRAWQRERWPWLPADFDWAYFNAAPEDQQLHGYFRGDEAISLLNLHPSFDRVFCHLPGLRARVMLAEADELRVITPDLDTVVIDADAGELHCLWRAVANVASESLEEISHLFVVHEPLDVRRSTDDYRQWLDRRLLEVGTEEQTAIPAEDEATSAEQRPPAVATEVSSPPRPAAPPRSSAVPDLVPLDSPVMAPIVESAVAVTPLVDADLGSGETEMMDMGTILTMFEQADTDVMTMGDLAALFDREAELLAQPLSFEAALETQAAELERSRFLFPDSADAPTTVAVADSELSCTFDFLEELKQLDDLPLPTPEPTPKPAEPGPPRLVRPRRATKTTTTLPPPPLAGRTEAQQAQRDTVLAALAAGEPCAGWDLSEADLAELDLAGGDFRGALLRDASLARSTLDGARFDESVLAGASLTGASLTGASFARADLSRALGLEVIFEEVTLEDAVAVEASFPGGVFDRCRLARADLTDADLNGASFDHTVLDDAFMPEANLDDATFVDSSLVETYLGDGATARRAVFEGCDLSGLRLCDGSDFSQASFKRAEIWRGRFSGAILQEANFSFAELGRANFGDADLTGAVMMGAKAREARFDRARLRGARLGSADLHEASFAEADLQGADLSGCNLFRAEFYRALTRDACFALANLKGTKLA